MSARSVRSRTRRQRPAPSRQTQRGVALLVAILLVALGTIIAAAVAYENAMTARRGTATYAFDQSLLIAQGAEALAAYGLRQIYQSDATHIYPGQGWDKPVGPIEVVPGVMLEASLEDLQGRFNLNNLVNTDGTPDPVELGREHRAQQGLDVGPLRHPAQDIGEAVIKQQHGEAVNQRPRPRDGSALLERQSLL